MRRVLLLVLAAAAATTHAQVFETNAQKIYSYGHRNPQGITIHPRTGEVWASGHGPLGGDEVNIIEPGANYDGSVITTQTARAGLEPPRFY
jgi:glucose/arabinose dehydrogenase